MSSTAYFGAQDLILDYEFVQGLRFDPTRSELNFRQRFSITVNPSEVAQTWLSQLCEGKIELLSSASRSQRVLLEALAQRQLLRFGVQVGGQRAIVLEELAVLPDELATTTLLKSVRFSRHTVVKLELAGACLTNPLARCQIRLIDQDLLRTVAPIVQGQAQYDTDDPSVRTLLTALQVYGFAEAPDAARREMLNYWEASDLAFHRVSQRRTLLNSGATYRHTGVLPELKPRETGQDHETISFAASEAALSPGFSTVGPAPRVTTRVFADNSLLKKAMVAEYLKWALCPQGEERRWPWPAPGGIYNFNCYLLVNELEDLPPGMYRFDLERRQLVGVLSQEADRRRLSQSCDGFVINGRVAPMVLILTADFPLLAQVYEKIAYRLQLITTGCILQSLYHWAPQFGIGIRPIGGGNNQWIEQELLRLEDFREISLLHLELGASPRPAP